MFSIEEMREADKSEDPVRGILLLTIEKFDALGFEEALPRLAAFLKDPPSFCPDKMFRKLKSFARDLEIFLKEKEGFLKAVESDYWAQKLELWLNEKRENGASNREIGQIFAGGLFYTQYSLDFKEHEFVYDRVADFCDLLLAKYGFFDEEISLGA